jgi:hypothetical protein
MSNRRLDQLASQLTDDNGWTVTEGTHPLPAEVTAKIDEYAEQDRLCRRCRDKRGVVRLGDVRFCVECRDVVAGIARARAGRTQFRIAISTADATITGCCDD